MHITRTAKPPNVSIELRTDVIQFMEYGNQLLFKRQIQKPWEEKRQDIQCLLALMGNPLNGPPPSVALLNHGTSLKSQRRKSSLNAPLDWRSRLGKCNRYFRHAYVPEFGMSTANVLTQIRHCPAEIKVLCHSDRSPDPSEVTLSFQVLTGMTATYEVT
jgi:hypothetical protein